MSTFVWITHPDVETVAPQPEQAVADIWGPKGWRIVAVDLAEASAALGRPVTDVRQLTPEYVRDLIKRRAAETAAQPAAPEPEPEPAATPARRGKTVREG